MSSSEQSAARNAAAVAERFSMKGRRALVTGVSLGREIAIAFAGAGADVAIHFSRAADTAFGLPEASETTAAEVEARGGQAYTMGVGTLTRMQVVLLPAALPAILVGMRIGLGVAWTAIIAAELAVGAKAGGQGGIGQMMFVFYAYSVELNGIVVCMVAVGIVALLLDRSLRFALARAVPWSAP